MAFDEHYHGSVEAIYVAALSIIIALLAIIFLGNKRWRSHNSGRMDSNDLQLQQHIVGRGNAASSPNSGDPDEAGLQFEVFLSFRSSNIQKTFTDYLYHSLTDAGIRVFRDNEELRTGDEMGPHIRRSIEQSKIGIPVFTADYASSKWCLMEVAEMVKSMKQCKQLIMPVFFDVTPDEVQHQRGSYSIAFSQYEKRLGRKKVQEWRDALREVVKLKGLELAKVANGHQGAFTKLVVAKVINELKRPYLEVGNVLVGIEDRSDDLLEKLEVGTDDVRVVGVWGMGGIGKTTLAKFVYNQIVDKFDGNSFLKDIRDTSKNPRGLQFLQSKLVSDILKREPDDYAHAGEGVRVLKERLRGTKALILLDDVDHVDQINALAAYSDWFGRGSRIIITTREKKVLDQCQAHDLYEVPLLDNDHALELFSMHTFRVKMPGHDFMKESLEIVKVMGGLPLIVEVIGSFLSIFAGRKDVWHDTIEKLKIKTDRDVQDKLQISYESLDHEQKEIFLDIACLFSGMDVRLVTPMWADAKFIPEVSIEILLLKSVIEIREDNTIWMHDQFRDLGRSIVRQEGKEPEQRSRLWHSEDAFDVLVAQQGSSKVEAINLEGYEFMEEEDRLTDDMFTNMLRLRFLELAGATLHGNFRHLFNQLRWLSWHRRNISPPENLILKNLIVFDLSRSLVHENWIGWSLIKIGLKLKVLNLGNCQISKTPDFSAFLRLESLILESCEELVSVDPSIGLLENLSLLNLRKCRRLKKLPEQLGSLESLVELLIDETGIEELPMLIGIKNLEVLSANSCSDLRELPVSIGSLTNLKRLSLWECYKLRELPDSIGQLTSLVDLKLMHTRISWLPDFIGDLHNLESLNISETRITGLPGNLRSLKKLKMLDASWETLDGEREIPDEVSQLSSLRVLNFCGIKSLPMSMIALSCLQTLHLKDCRNLQALPELPPGLINLRVQASWKMSSPNLGNLVNLKELSLSGDFHLREECLSSLRTLEKMTLEAVNICTLPVELGTFPRLKELHIRRCPQLQCLPALPSSLSYLGIDSCNSLDRLQGLSNSKKLLRLYATYCSKLREIEGLGNLMNLKVLWTDGSPLANLDGVEKLESLSVLSTADSEVERLPDLSKLKNVRTLLVHSSRKLVEIGGLGGLCNLTTFSAESCKSLEHLPELPKSLEYLYIGGCERITDIDVVAGLESLLALDIGGCTSLRKLPDLSRLEKLKSFTKGSKAVRTAIG